MSASGRWETCGDFEKAQKKQQSHEGFAAFWLVRTQLPKPFSLRSPKVFRKVLLYDESF